MNTDIIELLLRLKNNISAVEDGNRSETVFGEIEADYYDMLELMKLFLISERDSYYGYFLMNMQFKADFTSNSIAGIILNTFPPVFEANPLLLCKYSLKEILYIICHEIDHVVLNHPAEMIKANPTQNPDVFLSFNKAADAAVNDRINNEIVTENHEFLAEPQGIITSDSLSKEYNLGKIRSMASYEYYFRLLKNMPKDLGNSKNGAQMMMAAMENDEKSDEQENSEERKDSKPGDDDSEEPKVVTARNCGDNIEDHNWDAGDDYEDASAVVKEFVNAAYDTMSEETRGMMPSSFISQVEKLNKPQELSWQTILKKYVGTIVANKRKTRTRLDRRQPERFDISGRVDDKVLKIVVAIDTSASVSDRMIAEILNEIFAILAKRRHEITVIECDAKVQRVYKAKTPADIKDKVTGRGGTAFEPVIEYINNDKYYRDSLLIYFTDGYGEVSITRPLVYRNMWVVIGDKRNLSVKEPYGVVLSI